ncbi:MAG: hypothetical protein J3Q66DRAFT_399937 [Benniella sp.]|nr:MAG: hypothetical protein J3Q66DRAFT_399937 [Benniella sp.]
MEAIFGAVFLDSDMRLREVCDLFERLKSRENAIKEYPIAGVQIGKPLSDAIEAIFGAVFLDTDLRLPKERIFW